MSDPITEEPILDAHDFAGLAEEMSAAGSTEETSEQVVEMAAGEIEAEHAGVVWTYRRKGLETVATTTSVVEAAVRLHTELGEGPFDDPSWTRQTLMIKDLWHDQRWPTWSRAMAQLGVRSMLVDELTMNQQRAGVLCLFTADEREFSDDDIAFAHIFSRHAALALQSAERDDNLRVALDGRKLIGQAQGILMERFQLTADQAFAILKRLSQDNNRKLRDIATELVTTRHLPQ